MSDAQDQRDTAHCTYGVLSTRSSNCFAPMARARQGWASAASTFVDASSCIILFAWRPATRWANASRADRGRASPSTNWPLSPGPWPLLPQCTNAAGCGITSESSCGVHGDRSPLPPTGPCPAGEISPMDLVPPTLRCQAPLCGLPGVAQWHDCVSSPSVSALPFNRHPSHVPAQAPGAGLPSLIGSGPQDW